MADHDPAELDPAIRARLEAVEEPDDPDEKPGETRRVVLILVAGVLMAAGIGWIIYAIGQLFVALLH